MATLDVQAIHTFYGNIHALQGVSLAVRDREIVTLIGANGAGKSTTLRTISGLLQPRDGEVALDGRRINGVPPHVIVEQGVVQVPEGRRMNGIPPHTIVEQGVVQVPEGRRIFSRMTVLENLEMGAFARKDRGQVAGDLDRVFELFPRLKERARQKGGTLSGGEQQMLAIGRALMARPKILLLDEPSMGLAPILVETIFQTVEEINRQGVTVLLVEQNALMALQVAHRGYVLETGSIVLEDTAERLRANESVQKAYLGIE